MIRSFKDNDPVIDSAAYIDDASCIIGDVTIKSKSSIWPGASLRGDMNSIFIDEGSNVQDNSSLHTQWNNKVIIGKGVTVGHNAVIHGAKIGDNSLIGMGAIILDNAEIGKNCLIGAGALVTPNTVIPDNSMVLGSPAKVKRQLTPQEIESIKNNALDYAGLAKEYLNNK